MGGRRNNVVGDILVTVTELGAREKRSCDIGLIEDNRQTTVCMFRRSS